MFLTRLPMNVTSDLDVIPRRNERGDSIHVSDVAEVPLTDPLARSRWMSAIICNSYLPAKRM